MITVQFAATGWWFLPVVIPIAIWAAWSDLARMKIPNLAVLALLITTIRWGGSWPCRPWTG